MQSHQHLQQSGKRRLRRVSAATTMLLILMCGATQAAWAQWKWRDAAGRLQASDLPPPSNVPDKDILQRPAARPSAQATPPTPTSSLPAAPGASAPGDRAPTILKPTPAKKGQDSEADQRRKGEEQGRLARQRAEDERLAGQRQDNCQRAREAVMTLESGQRMARVNAKGEREILGDEQRAAETARAKAVIASDCR